MSSSDILNDEVMSIIRITRIIVIALMTGVFAFFGFILWHGAGGIAGGAQLPVMIGLAMTAGGIGASIFIPRMMRVQRQRALAEGTWTPQVVQGQGKVWTTLPGQLAQVKQTMTIIACAALEGPAFYNLVAYFQGANALNLGQAVALFVLIGMNYPNTMKWEREIEEDLRLMREKR